MFSYIKILDRRIITSKKQYSCLNLFLKKFTLIIVERRIIFNDYSFFIKIVYILFIIDITLENNNKQI